MQAKLLTFPARVALPWADFSSDAPLHCSSATADSASHTRARARRLKALKRSQFFQWGHRRELIRQVQSCTGRRQFHAYTCRNNTSINNAHFEINSNSYGHLRPVGMRETRTLPSVLSLQDAINSLQNSIHSLKCNLPIFRSGILRFQVPFPPESMALKWLQCIPPSTTLLPRIYFSQRGPRGDGDHWKEFSSNARVYEDVEYDILQAVAGVGSAVLFRGSKPFSLDDWKSIKRFLSSGSPLLRAYGSMRFNPDSDISLEWLPFGTFYFFIPQIEFCECGSSSMLAVNLAWDDSLGWNVEKSLQTLTPALNEVATQSCSRRPKSSKKLISKQHVPGEQAWCTAVDKILNLFDDEETMQSSKEHSILLDPSLSQGGGLLKVVLARRTELAVDGYVDPVSLLSGLQEKDPVAYQFCIQLPDLSTFFGSTPERLFAKKGLLVTSEAVAGTRRRGTTEMEDHEISIDLLLSPKDHEEFDIVHETIKKHMKVFCKGFKVDSYKSIIKQAKVQHLYAHFNAEFEDESDEFELLQALHPTPAVCGHPSQLAKTTIALNETFDRGMYAGPVGWFGGNQTEFAVGIRSALLQPQSVGTTLFLYAGVGIVKGANALSEWRELELKISQFEALLKPPPSLENMVNINALWATMIVEECSRIGITYFCIAPGSRSSPLAEAAAANPHISCISCIDERSLAFHALGYGRGANKPAVVVTSSGTAASNLYPAVVEASQDFVPMILLTADRPPELQDTCANQTIEQVKHFGSFVRHHVNLPPPDDRIPARIVLTTVDAAVFRASTDPCGPVHINCAFREPLAALPEAWNVDCLQGLQRWAMSSVPFTTYIDSSVSCVSKIFGMRSDLQEVGNLIRDANRGLLIFGGLHTAEETWAALKLSQHLGWPVFPDILSGLRLGKVFTHDNLNEVTSAIIYNFDHILLSRSVGTAIRPDVILQIGSRITSKRLSNFLEGYCPCAYILVEEHAFRSDPSHIISHRVKCSSVQFASYVLQATNSGSISSFALWLQQLSEVVQQEIQFHLQTEASLTEPFVAQVVAGSLPPSSALFLGSSMPIRDADMYAHGQSRNRSFTALESMFMLSSQGVLVASNRGASGIDGVLSTAIGFAAGIGRRVTLLLGDISFLHDTNGLTLLRNRVGQPPVTVVVVNNHGGSIFSLLPIANTVPAEAFTSLFSTPHDIQIEKLCRAHRVNYVQVSRKEELIDALNSIQQRDMNWVVEVESNIDDNAAFHKYLQLKISLSLTQAFHIVPNPQHVNIDEVNAQRVISNVDYHQYQFLLSSKNTTTTLHSTSNERIGFLLFITLSGGVRGVGEIAPLRGLHKEDLLDVEEQLLILKVKLQGMVLTATLPLLNGSISTWLWQVVGVQPKYILPSVRCGLEMAILGALASTYKCKLVDLLLGRTMTSESFSKGETDKPKNEENQASSMQHPAVTSRICALIDSEGSPDDIAEVASKLVKQGFCTLKLKVARRVSPREDAAVLLAIRKKVGNSVVLRADANRGWTFSQAMEFSNALQTCNLQFIEEPLQAPDDIRLFCRESRLPVAWDETIDDHAGDFDGFLSKYACSGVVALVLKPGLIGGFEKVNILARKARTLGIVAIISSSFESSVSLNAYAQFAAFLDCMQEAEVQSIEKQQNSKLQNFCIPTVAHGLGTYMWLRSDVVIEKFKFSVKSTDFGVKASSDHVAASFSDGHFDPSCVSPSITRGKISTYKLAVKSGLYIFHILDTMSNVTKGVKEVPTLLFLHGLLGSVDEWISIMNSLSISFRCVAVDLPGHGQTTVDESHTLSSAKENGSKEDIWSLECVADALSELLMLISQSKVVLVGYSMGARIALHMALKKNLLVSAAVIISGSPGLNEDKSRSEKCAEDDEWADLLKTRGIRVFIKAWYERPLWKSLRGHPAFESIKRKRVIQKDVKALARSLSSLSAGRQQPLWGDLKNLQLPLLLIVGKLDDKFVKIANQMVSEKSQLSCSKQAASHEGEILKGNGTVSRQHAQSLCSNQAVNLEEAIPEASFDLQDLPGNNGFEAFVKEDMKQVQLQESNQKANNCNVTTRMQKGIDEGNHTNMNILEIEDSGHAVHLENPLALIHALRQFVYSLD
ncbi:hypothetical protein O6H91_07G126900 [Diphasiastrum complanatum]|uniref:Uncharacterized protein n=1 Tax=Diphasiastrum complanatum TaxID=34168 RepID=A0ACC2D9M1_DIPCM|nr:hypothetical protein O6H91_07G126900 [Diphasiastrum complanatum]